MILEAERVGKSEIISNTMAGRSMFGSNILPLQSHTETKPGEDTEPVV